MCKQLRKGCGVGNGLDREPIDVVVVDDDDRATREVLAFQVLLVPMATPRWNIISGSQQYSSSEMWTSKCYHGHDQVITCQ